MAAINAQGTVITFFDGAINQVIGGVQSFSMAGTAPEREVTTLASTNVERKLGLPDFGSLTLELLYDSADAGQAAVIAAQKLNATREVIVTFSDATVKTFDATPKPLNVDGGSDDDLKSTLELTVAGTVVDS